MPETLTEQHLLALNAARCEATLDDFHAALFPALPADSWLIGKFHLFQDDTLAFFIRLDKTHRARFLDWINNTYNQT